MALLWYVGLYVYLLPTYTFKNIKKSSWHIFDVNCVLSLSHQWRNEWVLEIGFLDFLLNFGNIWQFLSFAAYTYFLRENSTYWRVIKHICQKLWKKLKKSLPSLTWFKILFLNSRHNFQNQVSGMRLVSNSIEE